MFGWENDTLLGGEKRQTPLFKRKKLAIRKQRSDFSVKLGYFNQVFFCYTT